MSDLSKIDKNFTVVSKIDKPDIVWYDAAEAPFEIYGAYQKNSYTRMPCEIAEKVSEGVAELNRYTSGVRARFRCNSPYIAIHVKWRQMCHSPHMTDINHAGFDLYAVTDAGEYKFIKPFFTPWNGKGAEEGYESVLEVSGEMSDYVINFPSYNDVISLHIGVSESASFEPAAKYRDIPPIVFYGSSITQGGCASRPGNIYQNFLIRWLNVDCINLGFSGNGKAEQIMCDYLAGLPMSVFVSDYDHNAPSPEHLEKTHFNLYKTVREKNPDLPYVMISKPDYKSWIENDVRRKEIIKASYARAIAEGDENVYFIDGESFFGDFERWAHTVDGCHPNDLGFYKMALGMYPVLKDIIEKRYGKE